MLSLLASAAILSFGALIFFSHRYSTRVRTVHQLKSAIKDFE